MKKHQLLINIFLITLSHLFGQVKQLDHIDTTYIDGIVVPKSDTLKEKHSRRLRNKKFNQYILEGLVIDDSTKKTVMWASIELKLKDSVIQTLNTDMNGNFVLRGIKNDNYFLRVCAPCYFCINNYNINVRNKKIEIYLKYKKCDAYIKSK